jgi:hypothetical protein
MDHRHDEREGSLGDENSLVHQQADQPTLPIAPRSRRIVLMADPLASPRRSQFVSVKASQLCVDIEAVGIPYEHMCDLVNTISCLLPID